MKSEPTHPATAPTDEHPEADVRRIVGGVVRRNLQSRRADRRRAVTRTLASWHIEGFEPDANYVALLERFVEGEITLARVRAETRRTGMCSTAHQLLVDGPMVGL